MHFEKRPTGGFLALDPGDHKLLKISKAVEAIPLNSAQLPDIMAALQDSIEFSEAALLMLRRNHDDRVFQIHGEIVAMHGLLSQIEHYRAMTGHASMTPQFDRELWGSLHDEPTGQQPSLTLISNIETDFNPSGPSIA